LRYRLTIHSAIAVVAASFSLFAVISGAGWFYAGIGAVIVVAGAGLATRLAGIGAVAAATGLMLIAVMPLLTGSSWAGRIGGVLLIGAMAGSALTRRLLPVLADAGTYLAGLFVYLNLVFAARQSWAWIVPTGQSVRHLQHIAQVGYAEHVYAPPVHGVPGLELIAAAGIGVIAILCDLVAVRLRGPAVAGLPLLVLFAVPVATNVKDDGVGLTLAFCVGITGYLALLAADGRDRLRLWGRLVTVWQDTPDDEDARGPDTRALAASGRRIGLTAVALAVVVPLALPAFGQHGLFGKDAAPGGSAGGPPVAAPKPLVAMTTQLTRETPVPVLTYRTTAADPRQQYLQMYVLNYDSASGLWVLPDRGASRAVGSRTLRKAPGLAPSTDFAITRTTITLAKDAGGGQISYLPVPYAPQSVSGTGTGWQQDNASLMLYAFRSDGGLRYTVTSRVAQPTQAELLSPAPAAGAPPASDLSYPGPNAAQLRQIARSITAGAKSRYQQAIDLQDYFTAPNRFTYALHGNLPTSVLQFLTTDKRGYCQQFSIAMTVLSRLLDIPARIAVGYTAGTQIRRGVWQVTTADEHAWPQLWFPGAGWVRFEPTPGGPTAQGTAVQPVYPGAGPGGTTVPLRGPSASIPAKTGASSGPAGIKKPIPEGRGGGVGGHQAGRGGGFPLVPVLALIIVALLIAPGLSRQVARRRRWLRASGDAGRAHAAWRELTGDLADLGLSGPASESPRALAQRVASMAEVSLPARQAVTRIAAAEERARYARTPGPAGSLREDAAAARGGLGRAAGRGPRWRARLMPASVLRPAATALREAADVFGWLDAAGMRLRSRPARPRGAD
jgi:transglutaminase-like putative cysteine protease